MSKKKKRKAAKKFETTERGFKIYGRIEDTRACILRVQESSAVGDTKIYIYCTDPEGYRENPHPHLNKKQACELIEVLKDYVQDCEEPENWRNDPEYLAEYADEKSEE